MISKRRLFGLLGGGAAAAAVAPAVVVAQGEPRIAALEMTTSAFESHSGPIDESQDHSKIIMEHIRKNYEMVSNTLRDHGATIMDNTRINNELYERLKRDADKQALSDR